MTSQFCERDFVHIHVGTHINVLQKHVSDLVDMGVSGEAGFSQEGDPQATVYQVRSFYH